MEWGGCAASPRDENFLREGGGRLRILSSVCLYVCMSVRISGGGLFAFFMKMMKFPLFCEKVLNFTHFMHFRTFCAKSALGPKWTIFTSKKLVRRALLRHWAQKDAKLSKFHHFTTFRTFTKNLNFMKFSKTSTF